MLCFAQLIKGSCQTIDKSVRYVDRIGPGVPVPERRECVETKEPTEWLEGGGRYWRIGGLTDHAESDLAEWLKNLMTTDYDGNAKASGAATTMADVAVH